MVNEEPDLHDVSLHSDDDNDDIDSVVAAYRRGQSRHQRTNAVLWHAAIVSSLFLIGLSLTAGGIASWLAVHSAALTAAAWSLIGLLSGLFLLLIGWTVGLLHLRGSKQRTGLTEQLTVAVVNMAALPLLAFHWVQFVTAKSSSGPVYSAAVTGWLALGLVVFYRSTCCLAKTREQNRSHVSTVATIS